MIKALLQGKPFRHPLHPALVHFPIGLFVISLLFDLAGLADPSAGWLVPAASYAMAAGIVTALVAAITGLADWSSIRIDHPAKQIANIHLILNLAAVGSYVVNLILRANAPNAATTPTLTLILSSIGVGLLTVSGYLGGRLVYENGIAVGRHRRSTPLPHRTLHVTDDRSDGFVAVADVHSLAEGETLRVQVNGYVMTVIRLNGQFFAFQEFCTHRYAPLSEGSFENGEVKCPWHGSCFDVRTGEVTQGPAKVDLRTYKVEVRDNEIYVRVPRQVYEEQAHKVIV
jgi:nitrite reductase/ring-hydroxylating ferredoxin subunit/uncharacterized membrane protein